MHNPDENEVILIIMSLTLTTTATVNLSRSLSEYGHTASTRSKYTAAFLSFQRHH